MLRSLVIIILFCFSLNRNIEISMKFSNFGKNQGWIFLDKMTFAPGKVQFQLKTSPRGIPYGSGGVVTFQAISQYQWQKQKQKKCSQNIPKQPYSLHRISVSQSSIDFSRKSFEIQQTTLYYFILKDCKRSLQSQYQNNNLSLDIKIHLINNGRQIGEEQDHWYIVPIVFFTGLWLMYYYFIQSSDEQWKTQNYKIIMFAGFATQIISMLWKILGFTIYVLTGQDFGVFHLIYLFLHSVSESLVICLIVLIGFGWTINFTNFKDADLYIPVICCMAMINVVLTLLTKLQTGDHDKHHIFDNISGYIIIGYRVLILIVFAIGSINTYYLSINKVKQYVLRFAIFGGLYISALPLIVLFGNIFICAKDRHQFVFIAIEGVKCLTNVAISLMINKKTSKYNQIRYEKRSFLPEDKFFEKYRNSKSIV